MTNYYTIDERAAKAAHDMNSMFDYKDGSTTAAYRRDVDRAAMLAEEQIEKKPDYREEIEDMLNRYARKLADWYNETSRVDSMCPSILVAGGAGIQAGKKAKQNARRDALAQKLEQINGILQQMKSIGTGGIKSSDEKAIYKLQQKIDAAKELQERMKGVNAFYRWHGTLDGCDLLSSEQLEELKAEMGRSWRTDSKPYESFALTNNSANILRMEQRVKELQAIKDAGTSEREVEGIEGLKIVENAEAMRIQLIFEQKPDASVRAVLKDNGFRWAPSQNAWQRHLNENGKWAAEQVLKKLKGA